MIADSRDAAMTAGDVWVSTSGVSPMISTKQLGRALDITISPMNNGYVVRSGTGDWIAVDYKHLCEVLATVLATLKLENT